MKHKIIQKFDLFFFIVILIMILFLVLSARAQTDEKQTQDAVASAGAFTLERSVVAGGGNQTAQQSYNQSGTTGQSAAGIKSTGGQFSLYSGFWTPEEFAPTAASVVAGGRILTADGRGIRNVRITITFPNGLTQTTVSSTFGYYRFTEIPAGETYIFSVLAKRHAFSSPTQVRSLTDDASDINFIADTP